MLNKLNEKGALDRKLTEKEKIIQEVVEKIELKIAGAMNGLNGELLKGGSEEFLNGIIKAYRIVETFDPNPPLKGDEFLEVQKNILKKWEEENDIK